VRLNGKEQEVLRTIAKWYREGKNDIDRTSATAELQISDLEYNTIMPLMENIGAIEAMHGQPSDGPNYVALDFTPLFYSEQLVRQIDEQIESEKRAVPSDFVQQLQSHVPQNPRTANKSITKDYKKCKSFIKRLRKIEKITAPDKRGEALSNLIKDMRQNGFDFPIIYHKTTKNVLQLLNKQIREVKIEKRKRIWFFIKALSIIIGIVAGIMTIISIVLHFLS
jgi:hypothetical protein